MMIFGVSKQDNAQKLFQDIIIKVSVYNSYHRIVIKHGLV